MGDIPAQIKIVCPGCNTQFRLKPKKGRLPEGAIPCPRCGEDIPVVEANLRHGSAPKAASSDPKSSPPDTSAGSELFKKAKRATPPGAKNSPRLRSGTAAGGPLFSHRTPMVGSDEIDRLEIAPGLTDSDPKSTFLGMGAGLMAIDAQRSKDSSDAEDHTADVDQAALDQIRSSAAPPGLKESGFDRESATRIDRKSLSETSVLEAGPGLAETSEQSALDRESLKRADDFLSEETSPNTSYAEILGAPAKDEPVKPADDSDTDATSQVPKQMVLGRIKIKQKLRSKLKQSASKKSVDKDDKTQTSDKLARKKTTHHKPKSDTPKSPKPAAKSAKSIYSESTKPRSPSLATLLKKARDRKIELPAPSERSSDQLPVAKGAPGSKGSADSARRRSAEALDRALNSLADETARALDEKKSKDKDKSKGTGTTKMVAVAPEPDRDALAYDTGDSSMIDLLRRRVAENQQPGAASERRGSGYIRLPTAEIQDVLGQGTYRLRVEDIIYEPIDKAGLTELVKRGVLMGAAEIAQSDGDWLPVGEHPVLAELRQRMAAEAHEMLSTLQGPPGPGSKSRTVAMRSKPEAWAKRPGLGGFDSTADDFADLKDSTEFPSIPPLGMSGDAASGGDPDFETANSGLFADVDALREPAKKKTTQKLFSAADISLKDPSETASTPEDAPRTPVATAAENAPAADSAPAAKPTPKGEPAPASDTAPVAKTAPTPEAKSSHPARPEPQAPSAPDDALPETHDDAPEALPVDFAPGKSSGGLKAILGVVVLLLVLAGLAISPIGSPYFDQLKAKFASSSAPDNTEAPAGAFKESAAAVAKSDAIAPAVEAARDQANEAANAAPDTAHTPPKAPEANQEKLAERWDKDHGDADLAETYYAELIDAKRYAAAGHVAVEAMVAAQASGAEEAADRFETLFYQAVEQNPALSANQPIDIDASHADSATLVMRGKKQNRLTFNLSRAQKDAFVFEPSQARFERDWRMSIASWRLCEVMVCHFEVPRARPARIQRDAFEKLIAADASATRNKLAALDWTREDGQEYLYGALIDAHDTPARFPIEYISLWQPWLALGDADNLKAPLVEGLAPLQSLDEDLYNPLLAQADALTVSQLAAQLSSVLLFDYLTNNWDRFLRDSDRWGTHLGLLNDKLVSTANLNAFQPRSSTRIKGRFEWSSRFSRSSVASLRLLKPEQTTAILFPEPSSSERLRVKLFWSQRERALKRIDQLVASQGQKAVLHFD